MGFQADARAAAVTLLTEYAVDASIRLQAYPGRPRSINPPTAFVDSIRERITYTGPTLRQRVPSVDLIVIHGLFDSKDAVDQKDAFVDGFLDWVNTRYHQAGANTLIGATETEDEPNYIPDWLPPEQQRVYYATRLTLEGLALTG